VTLSDWPDGCTLIGGIAICKALDEAGNVIFVERSFGDLLIPELLGMIDLTAHRMRWMYWDED